MTEMMQVDFSAGWSEIEDKFGAVLATAEGEDLLQLLDAGAFTIVGISQELAPVDTGFLRSTGQVSHEGETVIAGYAAEYSAHVEYGTSKAPAQPFLRPALEETDKIIEAMSTVHQRQINEASK